MQLRDWYRLLKPGDALTIVLALLCVGWLVSRYWSGEHPRFAVVRAAGQTVAKIPLDSATTTEVRGPLGLTKIEVQPGRARVASDPGPRQYCVSQGWLNRTGATAICAPNQVTLSLEGRSAAFDSLAY
jgi:hypothetical protein